MIRRITFAALLLSLVAAGCAVQAPAQQPAALGNTPLSPGASAPTQPPAKSGRIRFVYLTSVDMRDVPILIAFDALRAQGYTVEQTAMANSNLLVDVIARGDADMGTGSNQPLWTAISKGADLTTIAQKFTSTSMLMTKQEIKTCADLNGKSVASTAPGNSNSALLEEYVKRNCPGTKFNFVTIQDTVSRAAALISGSVDGTIIDLEFGLDLEKRSPGAFHALFSIAKTFPDVQVSGISVNRVWLKKNPELVKDFLRELIKANRQIIEHPELLYSESVKRFKLEPAFAKQVADEYLETGVWDPNGGMTRENTQRTIDFLAGINALPAGLKADDVADLSYLNSVLDELGRK